MGIDEFPLALHGNGDAVVCHQGHCESALLEHMSMADTPAELAPLG